ncbi:hypothetical protein AVEN_24611-1 [Araneus ventricosus]|uniref:Uncharacterized protein n=1 Tax=Araneus ventricosus TaxID=182803 RepID=A0A4Y2IKX5_ARAVE|nr:hypothetical protein AVEN_24611-1 [Araneus ventricosus]
MKSISRNNPGKNRCPASEESSSHPAAPLHCFGSDVPIVLTSMQGRGESLVGQDQSCRPGDPISYIPVDECVLSCPLLCGVLHYPPRTKPLEAHCHSCSFVINVRTFGTHLHLFPTLKSALLGRHFRSNQEVQRDVMNFLRSLGTDFNYCFTDTRKTLDIRHACGGRYGNGIFHCILGVKERALFHLAQIEPTEVSIRRELSFVYCVEDWSSDRAREGFAFATFTLVFVLPGATMAAAYCRIGVRLCGGSTGLNRSEGHAGKQVSLSLNIAKSMRNVFCVYER